MLPQPNWLDASNPHDIFFITFTELGINKSRLFFSTYILFITRMWKNPDLCFNLKQYFLENQILLEVMYSFFYVKMETVKYENRD